ncbi:unnamed protein product [Rotaria sp. Silwood1]|nr:unnamed protein product [Rotaria sp. Silwood1]
MRSKINRIINEQRFNQRLIASQKHTEVLVDIPQEELSKSILDRQNIKIIQENVYKQEWKKFPIENNIVNIEIIKEFNKNSNEETLLKTGCFFFSELETILSQDRIEQINLNQISNFTNTYLYNLQQGNYTLNGLQWILLISIYYFDINSDQIHKMEILLIKMKIQD